MKKFKWMERWDEKGDDFGGGVLYSRNADGELEQIELRSLG